MNFIRSSKVAYHMGTEEHHMRGFLMISYLVFVCPFTSDVGEESDDNHFDHVLT